MAKKVRGAYCNKVVAMSAPLSRYLAHYRLITWYTSASRHATTPFLRSGMYYPSSIRTNRDPADVRGCIEKRPAQWKIFDRERVSINSDHKRTLQSDRRGASILRNERKLPPRVDSINPLE
ncbi:hypothetical protein J6590_027725 [Homalodisca vitripennis]|nr:hypothetical protein J6590_027725 [Homalodisca vitripennis]